MQNLLGIAILSEREVFGLNAKANSELVVFFVESRTNRVPAENCRALFGSRYGKRRVIICADGFFSGLENEMGAGNIFGSTPLCDRFVRGIKFLLCDQ